MFLVLLLFCAVLVSACHRSGSLVPAETEKSPVSAETKAFPPPTADELQTMADLAGQGAQALAGLGSNPDVAHGATWFQGSVPVQGSTAYLLLGKLGEAGASTLRFVVRYQGQRPANFVNCAVLVDGNEAGSFSLAPNKFERLPDGSVLQIADIQFEDLRPAVLTMIDAHSAVIRTGDGQEIHLGRAELQEMRRVLAAYLHLQSQP